MRTGKDFQVFPGALLNTAERKHYRPMWNRLLPPIEKSAGTSRRSISNRLDRYRLLLLPEAGSVISALQRVFPSREAVARR